MNDAALYNKVNYVNYPVISRYLKKCSIEFQWNSGEQILDIGCGPGNVTFTLLAPILGDNCKLIGCDISKEMVEFANKMYKLDYLRFVELDIQQEDIDGILKLGSFDKIFSFFCIHWPTNQRKVADNILSLLKPGGQIFLLFVAPDNPIYLVLEEMAKSEKWKDYHEEVKWFYETDDPQIFFDSLYQDVGFVDVICTLKKEINHFPFWQDLMDFLEAISPFASQLPHYLKVEYLKDLQELIKQRKEYSPAANGKGFSLEFKIVTITAKKQLN